MKLVILVTIGSFNGELHYENLPSHVEAVTIVNDLVKNNPEIKPRATFQGKPEFKPGLGTVKETRMDKTKNGKDICIAKVIMDGTAGELECSYLPPQKTWRAGERVNVVKGQYGPEMKEIDNEGEPPF